MFSQNLGWVVYLIIVLTLALFTLNILNSLSIYVAVGVILILSIFDFLNARRMKRTFSENVFSKEHPHNKRC